MQPKTPTTWVTSEGLHVGQKRPTAFSSLPEGYFGDGPTFDYFVPHDRITSVARSRYGLPDRPVPPDSLTADVN